MVSLRFLDEVINFMVSSGFGAGGNPEMPSNTRHSEVFGHDLERGAPFFRMREGGSSYLDGSCRKGPADRMIGFVFVVFLCET